MQARSFLMLGIAAAGGIGCGDPAGPQRQVVDVNFTSAALPPGAPASAADVAVTVGANTLVISRAEFVIRRIKVTTDSLDCDDHDDGLDHCAELMFRSEERRVG